MDIQSIGKTRKGILTRERIFKAALSLIQTKGYDQTTLVDICTEAGIATGTFYHYFKSKQDILVGYVQQESLDLTSFYTGLDKTLYADALIQVISFQADYFIQKGTEFVSNFYAIMLLSKPSFFDYTKFSLLEIIYDCFVRGQQNREFTDQYTPNYMQELAIGLLYITTSAWCISEGSNELKPLLLEQYRNLLQLLSAKNS